MHEHVRGTQRVRACLQVHCQTRLDAKRRELVAQVFVSGVQPKLCAAKRMIAHGVHGQRAPGTRTRTVVCPTPCRCAGELTTTIRDLKLWAYRPRVNKEVTSTERGAAFKAFSLRSRSGMFAIQFFSTAQSSCASHHRCCFQCLSMGLKITEGAPENPQAG